MYAYNVYVYLAVARSRNAGSRVTFDSNFYINTPTVGHTIIIINIRQIVTLYYEIA